MAHVIGFKLDTISEERRDRILVALTEVLNLLVAGGDEVTMTFTAEGTLGVHTKKKTTYTHKWEPGQDLPTLDTFEIMERQRSMFDTYPDIHVFRLLFRDVLLGLKKDIAVATAVEPADTEPGTAEADAETETPPDDQPAATDTPGLLDPFRRTLEDIERAEGYTADEDDDDAEAS